MQSGFYRGRRLRRSQKLRQLVEETQLQVSHLIQPYFVVAGKNQRQAIASMPGIERLSVDQLLPVVESAYHAGVRQIILFGVHAPETKDPLGKIASQSDGPVQQALLQLKKSWPDLLLITDVCLCGATDHGHCGVLNAQGQLNNDASLELLANIALSHAQAGADMVAPSDMMDGRIAAIRKTLDGQGYQELPILSYAAKFASSFYGPFRDAAQSSMKAGEKDRRGYQLNPANAREAMREIAADIEEGADLVMIKPALPYLDIIQSARRNYDRPVTAYCVSGEYSMIKAAAAQGWLDEKAAVLETLIAIRRAGADAILTYHAHNVATWLK